MRGMNTDLPASALDHAAAGIGGDDALPPKRRAMLDAAEALFLTHGYGAVSMDSVARTAGVSKATLYAHFESKDRLFASIVLERGLAVSMDQSLLPDHVTDLRATLEAIGQHVMAFMLRERTLGILRVAIAESARFPEVGQAFFENGPQAFTRRVAPWVRRQQEAGLLRTADAEGATQQLMALLRSVMFLRAALFLPPPPTPEEVAATVHAAVDTWLRAFGAVQPLLGAGAGAVEGSGAGSGAGPGAGAG